MHERRRPAARGAYYAPDVAIADIRLPPTHSDDGLRAALEIRAQHPEVGVLVLSHYVKLGLKLELLSDSAAGVGYLLKDRIRDVDEFVAAVRRVAAGGSALDPIIASTLLSRERHDDPVATLMRRRRSSTAPKITTGIYMVAMKHRTRPSRF